MERLYLYTGSLFVCGLVLGGQAVFDLLAGESGITLWLLAVGGAGMALTSAYQAATADPDEFRVRGGLVLVLVLAALAAVLGVLFGVFG